MDEVDCGENDRLCTKEAVWITQNMLLAARGDMDDIVNAIEKIRDKVGKKYGLDRSRIILSVSHTHSAPVLSESLKYIYPCGPEWFKVAEKNGMIYYLTGAPVYENGKRVAGLDKINMGAAKGIEYLHLVTYNIPKGEYKDLGPVFYEDGTFPTYVNSIAVGTHDDVYTLARFMHEGKEIEDIVRINLK